MPYLISFSAGLLVGLLYYFSRVLSPAPPLIALVGLLGIVMGEKAIPYVQAHLSPPQVGVTSSRQVDGPDRDHSPCSNKK